MKKLVFLSILGFLSTEITAQVKWEYPITPGSDAWRSFTTSREMVDACKIPEATLENMTTAELLQAWENFPLKLDVIAFNSPQKGFEVQKEISDALKWLLTKADAGEVVLRRYQEAKAAEAQIYSKQHPEISINDYWMLKLLVSQPEILSKISDVKAKNVLERELRHVGNLMKVSSSLDIRTPRGTSVSNTVRSDGANDPWEPWVFDVEGADEYYRTHYPQATIMSSSTRTYNCHSYAWANGYTNRCWINTPGDDLYFQEPAGDGSYDELSESVSTKVSYSGDHSATTTGTANVYISKWGQAPLMQHNKNYVPAGYGSTNKFWRRSVDVPQDQSSINAAVSAAVSGQTVNVSSGSYSLTGDISLLSGRTLSLLSGATANLNGYSIILAGGTLNKQTGSTISGLRAYLKNGSTIKRYCGLIQTACTNAATQDVVEVQSGTFTENISVSGKSKLTITGKGISQTYISGTISIFNATNWLNLNSFRCNRIYLNGCQAVSVSSTRITGSGSGGGLSTYNSTYSGLIVTIENALTGLEAHSSSGGLYSGTHILDTGGSVSASYSSNINLYTNQQPNWVELCGIDNAHLAAAYGAYISATNCSYDNGIPVIDEYQGTVDVFGAYNCNGSSSSARVATNHHQEGVNAVQGNDPALVEFREANTTFFDLSKRVSDDISATGEFDRQKFSGEYVNVITKFKSFIDKNPSSALSKTALTTAVHCFRALEDHEAMKSFLKKIKDDAKLSNVSGLAKRFMIDYHSSQKDFDNAIATANEIMKEQTSDKELVCDVLFAKGLIHSHDLNQPAEAAQCFSNIINNYPDNPLVNLAENELELLGYEVSKNAKQTAADDGAKITEFSAANYPNPFNPATEIRYALPSAGQVTIRVFNILGEQVRLVVDDFKLAGRHTIVWDGKNNQGEVVASGIYIYRISYLPSAEAGGNGPVQPIVRTGKMNLLR